MAVLRLSTARRRYPEADFSQCADPKHDPAQNREPVAVLERGDKVTPVCKSCLPRLLGEWYTDN